MVALSVIDINDYQRIHSTASRIGTEFVIYLAGGAPPPESKLQNYTPRRCIMRELTVEEMEQIQGGGCSVGGAIFAAGTMVVGTGFLIWSSAATGGVSAPAAWSFLAGKILASGSFLYDCLTS